MLFPRRYVLGVVLAFVLLIGIMVFTSKPNPMPPLPFNTNGFIASSPPTPALGTFTLPKNASIGQRLQYFLFKFTTMLPGKSPTWSFSPSPTNACSIQGLLNQCMEVNGTRYLMPIGVAAGLVQFGNTNVLDGPHWVSAFENALRSDRVQCWDPLTKRTGPEHLVLLRFPAQKVVVVLPAKAVVEFERTNRLPSTDPKASK